MAHQILDTGMLNVAGVCHAICCKWVKQSRALGDVVNPMQLGSPMALFMNWQHAADAGNDWHGINANYHLPAVNVESRPQLDAGWLATKSSTLNGYALIVLWGSSLNVQAGAHQWEGHTVAVRKEPGHMQYFDPNIGTFQFANSLEMYNWMSTNANSPYMAYPTLRNREVEFARV